MAGPESAGGSRQPVPEGPSGGVIIAGCAVVLAVAMTLIQGFRGAPDPPATERPAPAPTGTWDPLLDRSAMASMAAGLGNLLAQYARALEQGLPPEARQARLEAFLRETWGAGRPPMTPGGPCTSPDLVVVEGQTDLEAMRATASAQAQNIGQTVYLIQYPGPGPGWLAGAVRLHEPVDGAQVQVKLTALP